MSAFYKLSIKEITRETPQAVSIAFNIPEELKSLYQFTSGQYVTLKLTLNGEEIRRAYSICSTPQSNELRIAVKAVKDGFFSKFANTKLFAGNVLEVGTPEGKFTFEPQEKSGNYILFGAGSGITPLLSIAVTALELEPESTVVLVYGNKTPSETIFYAKLEELQQRYSNRFFIHYVFSQANVENALFGRIDKAAVNFVLNNKHKDLKISQFFLCGPEEMIKTAVSVLKENNIPESYIKYELFSTSESEVKTIATADGNTQVTVLLDGEEAAFEMNPKHTLLEAALKNGIDAPYSCRGGICSSCMARVTKGKAEMERNQILTDDEIANGLILTCQAHPVTAEIEVDYDDV